MLIKHIELMAAQRRWRADLSRPVSLAIPLEFDGPQPSSFGAAAAHAEPLHAGAFVGDVKAGGSCMCSTYTLTPHCNGTHTESVGHVVREDASIHAIATDALFVARLITVTPAPADASDEHSDPPAQAGDYWITAGQIEDALAGAAPEDCEAIVIRTLPNPAAKQWQHHDAPGHTPAYFTMEAMRAVLRQGSSHLVVDLPSVDRTADDGKLTCHRIFWGLPPASTRLADASRAHATITELAYVDNALVDGLYLLNLQLAPFATDAAPSRPVLYPLELLP